MTQPRIVWGRDDLERGRLHAIELFRVTRMEEPLKRLNNDAAAKANKWLEQFGTLQVVPTAVLGGVYKLRHLEAAQDGGLMLIWAHDLATLLRWIAGTSLDRRA